MLETSQIIQARQDSNYCYSGQVIKPVGIVVHSTGCNNPNLKRYVNNESECGKNAYQNYFGGKLANSYVMPHAVIGYDKNLTVRVAQTLDWKARPAGCGPGSKGSYNKLPNGTGYIQFEIAEDNTNSLTYLKTVYEQAADLCAYLIHLYPDIKISNIVSHKEAHARGYASNHGDPEHWFSKYDYSMDDFRKLVQVKLKAYEGETEYYATAVFNNLAAADAFISSHPGIKFKERS